MLFLFSLNQRSVNMIYFDTVVTVANLVHDIWKGLAPSPKSNETRGYKRRHAAKGNYLRKEVKLEIFKRFLFFKNWGDVMKSNFSKLERYI